MKYLQMVYRMIRLSKDPHGFLSYLATKFGDPFYILAPKKGTWFSGTEQAAKQIFSSPAETFGSIDPSYIIEGILGEHSMVLQSGQAHLSEKKQLSQAFHGSNLETFSKEIERSTHREINRWRSNPEKLIDLHTAMTRITLDVIIHVIFGITEKKLHHSIAEAAMNMTKAYTGTLALFPVLRKPIWPAWRRFSRARKKFDDLLLQEIQHLKNVPDMDRRDVLAKLTQVKIEDERYLTDDEILGELRTFLVAGHETTAISLVWAISHVLQNDTIGKKLQTEIKKSGSLDIDECMKSMPYLLAICKESLRKHPVVPTIIRTIKKPFELNGRLIQPDSNISLAITLLHHNKQIWQNPEIFDPDRFIDNTYTQYQYAPFGGGIHRCIGASLAMLEMQIILKTIFSEVELNLVSKTFGASCLLGLTVGPSKPIFVRLKH